MVFLLLWLHEFFSHFLADGANDVVAYLMGWTSSWGYGTLSFTFDFTIYMTYKKVELVFRQNSSDA